MFKKMKEVVKNWNHEKLILCSFVWENGKVTKHWLSDDQIKSLREGKNSGFTLVVKGV